MRLELFRQLSKAQQKEEVEKNKAEIRAAYIELCNKGKWNENASKELKETGEAILWEPTNYENPRAGSFPQEIHKRG